MIILYILAVNRMLILFILAVNRMLILSILAVNRMLILSILAVNRDVSTLYSSGKHGCLIHETCSIYFTTSSFFACKNVYTIPTCNDVSVPLMRHFFLTQIQTTYFLILKLFYSDYRLLLSDYWLSLSDYWLSLSANRKTLK